MQAITNSIPPADKRWLSIQDFTRDYSISRSTQQRLRSEGKLPFSKIGKIIRYDRLKIDEFFSNHSVA